MSAKSPQDVLLETVISHLVLPPKLPASPDEDSDSLNWDLTGRLLKACEQLRFPELESIRSAVEASLLLTNDLHRTPISKERLLETLSRISHSKDPGWLLLHVVKQNAAIIIRKNNDTDEVVFEAFESSATVTAVLDTKYALQWSFPSRCVAIPSSEFRNVSFQDALATFLEQATEVAFDQFAARARKGDKLVVESRDTPSPALILEMLMSFLEAMGGAVPVHAVHKRVRDDVVLGSSESPWRRSPYWLALRVFIQRIILDACSNNPKPSRIYFKVMMCVVFAQVLSDCHTRVHPEKALMLQAKLCRRLAKLQTEVAEAPATHKELYQDFFIQMKPFFEAILRQTKQSLSAQWEAYKRNVTRSVPILPKRAEQSDLVLHLQNSGKKLRNILDIPGVTTERNGLDGPPSFGDGTMKQVNQLAARYEKLLVCARMAHSTISAEIPNTEAKCVAIAEAMVNYMTSVGTTYVDDAILMSQYLLKVFELWVAMDLLATKLCPLLQAYHPAFVPEALDMFCLMSQDDMERVRKVQSYLGSRVTRATKSQMTIFSDPHHYDSFPASYVREGYSRSELLSLRNQIEDKSVKSERRTEEELDRLMEQYEKLSLEMTQGTCCCTRNADGSRNVKGCKRCWKWRSRNRLKVNIHEAFLPKGELHRSVVLLELNLPGYFAAYRDATWRLKMLGKKKEPRKDPVIIFADFEPLQPFQRSNVVSSLTLASSKKSFQQTHFRQLKLPKSKDEVLLPFGPTFTYYDKEHGVWADECQDMPWYHHLLGSWLPNGVSDPFSEASLYMDKSEHPSSYEIAARQDTCPANMSCHEFTAYQAAISGFHRRWAILLLELGSSNLNPSSNLTRRLFTRLAVQSGPANLDSGSDVLGKVHSTFQDVQFCEILENQIHLRLNALDVNRRDLECVSILIALSLRLYHLCPSSFRQRAGRLLSTIRELLSLWITKLREELRCAGTGEAACKAASNTFWAAMLCRQTFQVFQVGENGPDFGHREAVHFFRASVALPESLIVGLDGLSQHLSQLLAQDMSWAYTASDQIKEWTLAYPAALESVINETWTCAGSRLFTKWQLYEDGHWMTSTTTATAVVRPQTVHYHLLQGHLLVDGQALGKLPLEVREDKAVMELFQGQHLLTRPSGVTGMEYQVVNSIHKHEVHVGLRQGRVVIRAIFNGFLLEHISREIFKSGANSDLPSGLVDSCVHWLNLDTGELEIRRKPNIWMSKYSNWILNVRSQTAMRGRKRGPSAPLREGSYLVEPQSELGRSITNLFRDFENPGNLTIFQPVNNSGRLSVEIKRLEMQFEVNNRGLLQSKQLQSEIDPRQQIGTLHGLQSMIVLRNVKNFARRSVIVPIGTCSWQRQGPHVSIKILNEGNYARFTVDTLLGRLTCAPEPALFYLKALLHALTSFPLPDELTGRTGTEEACLCLTAGQSQPWKPLNLLPKRSLFCMIDLSPKRKFYPPNARLYQNVSWDNGLTATIQHEQLAIHAGEILRQSRLLDIPEKDSDDYDKDEMNYPDLDHLSLRGILRRQVYERVRCSSDSKMLAQTRDDKVYNPRGSNSQSKNSTRTYCTIKILQQTAKIIPPSQVLLPLLQKWSHIAGFTRSSTTIDIGKTLHEEVSEAFGPLVARLRSSNIALDYMAQLSLAVFAFRDNAKPAVIAWLVAIAKNTELRELVPPDAPAFTDFHAGQTIDLLNIKKLIISAQDDYATRYSKHGKRPHTSQPSAELYDSYLAQGAERIASWLQREWPDVPQTYDKFIESYEKLNVHPALNAGSYAAKPTESTVRATPSIANPLYQVRSLAAIFRNIKSPAALQLGGQQLRETAVAETSTTMEVSNSRKTQPVISKELSMLKGIVQPFKKSHNAIHRQYGQDLEDSIVAMAEYVEPLVVDFAPNLTRDKNHVEKVLYAKLDLIRKSLCDLDPCYSWLAAGHLWPCDSLAAVLEQLRVENYKHLKSQLKSSIARFGILVTELQHLERINDAKLSHDDKWLMAEYKSTGHSNWNPSDYPEWLLLEIDNNILIRPVQVEVAMAIISLNSNKNSVLQMNMGTGKTSVVLPMAALVLANETKLCRVIVPKALLLQTAQVIQSRIGGLIGRRVRHVPFTRRSPSDRGTLSRYWTIHKEMLESGGVMVCLPAHMLSFKLSGLQRLADGQKLEGKRMLEIQNWLNDNSRDILDESDLTLSVYTQLIYPSGDLTVLDGHPYRWLVVEALLSLVERHASNLQKTFDGKVVVVQRHHGYPIIHFLSQEPEDALNSLLVEDICAGRFSYLQIQDSSSNTGRNSVKEILSGVNASESVWQSAIDSLKDEVFGSKVLYLLRGLIAERILLLCLKKKWNIQYGLHPERQPIAVPFEAKGVPSQAAEYGHPDTALLLTCLAFYHQGLSKEQIKQGLQGVIQSDDAAVHYDRWICSCTALPPTLRYWSSIDPENDSQVELLWKYLRFDRTVINYHMNKYVFPRYAKQFSVKLQASGWDIPLLQPNEKGQHGSLTTGFSGTNDNKRILPQTIQQDDLPKLLLTNAEVLCHLLESRNRECYLAATAVARFSEKETLGFLYGKGIRVLIDSGAHILEMENQEVAKAWLDIDIQAQGAVFFKENGQIMVCSRFQTTPMPLLASPFANDLSKCVVYIDEGHTRGTDLKLPVNAKGAVTLGLGQTKDQTVQAAMRLRQLGTTQSVAFLAPPEVHRSILDVRRAYTKELEHPVMLTSSDVVRWLLEQSCNANEQMMGLHFSQCQDFCRRTDALWKHTDFATNSKSLSTVLDVVRQKEQQTLQLMYGPDQARPTGHTEFVSPQLRVFAENVTKMTLHGRPSSTASALMEVEQEREVEFEVEQMREKQTSRHYTALKFPGLHPAIRTFVKTGELDTEVKITEEPFRQAFDFVGRTRIGTDFRVKPTASRLYVSGEFSRTVASKKLMVRVQILRPVNWILWSPSTETALVIIPEEAEAVIPMLRKIRKPLVWLLGYSTPVTKSMQVFNDLVYLTIPAWPGHCKLPTWLGIEVGILSGRLYFRSEEYKPLLSWLGILPEEERRPEYPSGLQIAEPLQFLQEWVAFRRQTDDIQHTPVGFVCQRQQLHDGHFFFSSPEANVGGAAHEGLTVAQTDATVEDDDMEDVSDDGGVDYKEEL